jgi:hypothetical protein
MSSTLAFYIAGEPPAEFAAIGFVEGWNAVYRVGEAAPEVTSLSAMPMSRNLVLTDELTIGGSWTAPPASDDLLCAVSDLDEDTLVAEGPAADPWSLTVVGEPPEACLIDLGGLRVCLADVRAAADLDGSGDCTVGDEAYGVAHTEEGVEVALVYAAEPDDLDAAYTLPGQLGARVGWVVSPNTDAAEDALDEAEANRLVLP